MPKQATKTILVKAPASEVYRSWSDFERFPMFMRNIESVTKTGPDLSHWVAEGPMGTRLEWEAQTTMMEENKRIGWNSFEGDIETTGQVTFNELPTGHTEVTATFQYDHPNPVAGWFDNLDERLEEDLRNFKNYVETGVAPMAGTRR